ncbi:MAG: anti-sigma regulatory factor [candidate division Zixibacteria bacterium]|nr:anti-sigma regulatory factor [Candidatus Tariuqbacter arcticus]
MHEERYINSEIIPILEERDVVICRQACREWARRIGFNLVDQTRITTAASELARNIHEYAGAGEVIIQEVEDETRRGIKITFQDQGPGLDDVEEAMKEGYTSHKGMGMGLPGSKKLMDEFYIQSEPEKGTSVTIYKWLPI